MEQARRSGIGVAEWFSLIPLPLGMILLALAIGAAAGLGVDELVERFNTGFGRALGDFALILIPAFILASAMDRTSPPPLGRTSVFLAPITGAGMICPDTSYAAISPMAGNRRLSVAFGSYAGFKLLFPAGPMIVATALGALGHTALLMAIPMFVAAWAVGVWFARRFESPVEPESPRADRRPPRSIVAPLAVLVGTLVVGFGLGPATEEVPLVSYLLAPKGALLLSALAALAFVPSAERGDAISSGMRQTASLLLTIGAASAIGFMIIEAVPVGTWAKTLVGSGMTLVVLFVITVAFKLIKGSSMATFAAVGGLAGALMPSLEVSPTAATLAICAGSFGIIAPNDSFYWLIKENALAEVDHSVATKILATGALLQGLTAMAVLLMMERSNLL